MSVTLHTSIGDIKIEVFCESVTRTAENFLAQCARGTYDGVKFHRVVKDFMAQTGDPTGTGKGGQSIWEEPFADEIRPALRHTRKGTVSMARVSNVGGRTVSGPNCNGSQFFITLKEGLRHLDGEYSVFGVVIDGMQVLETLNQVAVDKKNRPLEEITIERVTIHANPIASTK